MRLDKFLKVSRLIKRRTVANDACTAGRVSINGKVAKAGAEVKINDIISVVYGDKKMSVKVLKISDHVTKDDAAYMYQVIDE